MLLFLQSTRIPGIMEFSKIRFFNFVCLSDLKNLNEGNSGFLHNESI